jgi:alpha-beta hydrolase superfamily lysophospholipase
VRYPPLCMTPSSDPRRESAPLARGGGPSLYFYVTLPRTPLVAAVGLLHGYGEHAGRYAHVMDAWARRGIGTVALDMRGHGRAEGPRGYCDRFDDYLDDAAQLTRLVGERAPGVSSFLFGHSFGGLVATSQILAEATPWRGLMLSAPYFGTALKVPAAKRLAGQVASRFVPRLALPMGFHGSDVTHDPIRARAYDEDPLVFGKATARWFVEAELAQSRALARAPSLALPLYLVMGTKDPIAELAAARAVMSAAGSKDKTSDIREGLFHEPCNELEWPQIVDALADWMLARV